MPDRESRRIEAEKHIALVKRVFDSETKQTAENALFYQDGEGRELEIPAAQFEQTNIEVRREDCASVACSVKGKVALLDFASFIHPGGGYENGAWAQEEALCAESNLFPILGLLEKSYYEPNRTSQRGGLYTDHAIYLADVRFTHNGSIHKADVIVAAAPNRTKALVNHRAPEECDADLTRRIEAVMRIAAANGCPTLVLGAFGCGVFGNDPIQVSGLFKAWLKAHPGVFEHVIFAVPGGPNFQVFDDAFETPKPQVEEVQPEEEDDEESLEDIELPEGIMLR